MGKWKCEICDSEFDNFQAQGFNNKIYCPLCYYKELYRKTELEIDRLNNIINEYKNMKKELLEYIYHNEYCRFGHIDGGEADDMYEIIHKTDKLKELKEGNNGNE